MKAVRVVKAMIDRTPRSAPRSLRERTPKSTPRSTPKSTREMAHEATHDVAPEVARDMTLRVSRDAAPKARLQGTFAATLSVVLLAATLVGCEATSSTEVGVRTTLLGVLEDRGQQQIYAPGGIYFVAPLLNAWVTIPINQQNLSMNADPEEGARPIPDDITFKTRDGNNVFIDVNVMWRVDPTKAGTVISQVGESIDQIMERLVRPVSRSVIRDVFNEITSEQYYQVTYKNQMAAKAKDRLAEALAPYGIIIDMLQVQQHRFDAAYQNAINAQKQAEADVQTLGEQQKNMVQQKQAELEAKRSEWNRLREDANGAAGRIRNEADGYYQTKSNEAKAILAAGRAKAEATRKEAEALGKLGGDSYVKMQLAKQLAKKRILIVPASSVTTTNVNQLLDFLMSRTVGGARPRESASTSDSSP